MRFIGIDLHSDKFTAGFWDTSLKDEKIILKTFHITEESIKRFYEHLDKETYVVVEASTNAFWFHSKIADRVKECFVCIKRDKKRNKNKSDKIDTKELTKLLAVHIITEGRKNILETVYVPKKEVQELRGLFSSRKLISKQATQLKNRMHSIFKQNGICVKRDFLIKDSFLHEMVQMEFDDIWKIQLEILYNELQLKNTAKGRIDADIY